MSAVVADTHALIWYTSQSSQLSPAARSAMEMAESQRQPIFVPIIVVVELRYLVERRTITEADYQLILTALRDPATVLVAQDITLDLADAVSRIPRAIVPDMPDRIVAASALALGLPLVTKDQNIRRLTNLITIW